MAQVSRSVGLWDANVSSPNASMWIVDQFPWRIDIPKPIDYQWLVKPLKWIGSFLSCVDSRVKVFVQKRNKLLKLTRNTDFVDSFGSIRVFCRFVLNFSDLGLQVMSIVVLIVEWSNHLPECSALRQYVCKWKCKRYTGWILSGAKHERPVFARSLQWLNCSSDRRLSLSFLWAVNLKILDKACSTNFKSGVYWTWYVGV